MLDLQYLLVHRLQLLHSVLGIELHEQIEILSQIGQPLLHLLQGMPFQVGALVLPKQLALVEAIVLDGVSEMTQVFDLNFEILMVERLVNIRFIVHRLGSADAELAVELRHRFRQRVDKRGVSDGLHAHWAVTLALVVAKEARVALEVATWQQLVDEFRNLTECVR